MNDTERHLWDLVFVCEYQAESNRRGRGGSIGATGAWGSPLYEQTVADVARARADESVAALRKEHP